MNPFRLPLLVVGLDAACWDYVDPFIAKGVMPNLAGLRRRGSSGILHSTMPALTPVAWSTLATGKNPGKHGVFEWNWLDHHATPPQLQIHSGHSRRGTPFWQRLNEAGHKVGLVNIPLTYPPAPVDGFLLCGYPTHDPGRNYTYPAGLLAELEAVLGPYMPGDLERITGDEDWLTADRAAQRFQVRAAIRLAPQLNLSAVCINLMLPDHANHLAPDMAGVEAAYQVSDEDLGELLSALQPQTVVLLSDHGSRRVEGKFYLNQWLHDRGLVNWQARPAPGPDDINWLLGRAARTWPGPRLLRRLRLMGLRRWIQLNGSRLPAALIQELQQTNPADLRRYLYAEGPDWAAATVYAFGNVIYFHPTAAAQVEPVRQALLALRDDAGRPVFDQIHRGADLYHGAQTTHAPALVLDNFDSPWGLRFDPNYHSAGWFSQTNISWRGEHSRDGLYVVAGDAFLGGQDDGQAALADIPATLLYLLDTPIPADYDGRLLTELIRPELLAGRPVRRGAADPAEPAAAPETLSAAEEAAMAEQLRALGYIE